MATRRRKGHIAEMCGRRGTRYRAVIGIGNRQVSMSSRVREECEAWLARMVEENPTWEWDPRPAIEAARRAAAVGPRGRTGGGAVPAPNPFARRAEASGDTPRWMVAAETNPLTARYHFRLRGDWRPPERVLVWDYMTETPVAWVADDNGGGGYGSREEARLRMLSMPAAPSVALTVRPLSAGWGDRFRGRSARAENIQSARP